MFLAFQLTLPACEPRAATVKVRWKSRIDRRVARGTRAFIGMVASTIGLAGTPQDNRRVLAVLTFLRA